jgi:hypothetical protein
MYFISRNNKFYQYIAHTKYVHRYVFTAITIGMFIVGSYFLQQLIDVHDALCAQELKSFRNAHTESKKIGQRNNQLLAILDNAKKNNKAVDVQKNSHEFFKDQLLFVLESARQSGLVIQSYGAHKEKDAQWYTKELAHGDFSGSLEQVLRFLDTIKNSKKMISISRWSLSHGSDALYTLNCDIGFLHVA